MSPRSTASRWKALVSSCAEYPRSLPASGHYPAKGEGFRLCRLDPRPAAGSADQLLRGETALASGQWPLSGKGGRIPAMSPRSGASRWRR